MRTYNDRRAWWRIALVVLRRSIGVAAVDVHKFANIDGDQECSRAYTVWGVRVARREICSDYGEPHELGYSDEPIVRRHCDVIEYLATLWAMLALVAALGGAFALWHSIYVAPGSMPGAHGEPLPRDWRAVRRVR